MATMSLTRCVDCRRNYSTEVCPTCYPDGDDPEIVSRIAAAREAKRANLASGGLGDVSPDVLDAVLPPVESARTRRRLARGCGIDSQHEQD